MPTRSFYLDLAARGHVVPIGTDLVLHTTGDPATVVTDGRALGRVIIEAARRWQTPLAVPLMDLQVEKAALLRALGMPAEQVDEYHLDIMPAETAMAAAVKVWRQRPTPRIAATLAALRVVAGQDDLLPIGMCIGPFSLMTKLVADPITPVFLAGLGTRAEDDPDVARVESVLALGQRIIEDYVRMQLDAGARAIIVCEPAANVHYLSPNQLDVGSDIFDRYVMAPNRALKAVLNQRHADLIFHDCGELTDTMVEAFGTLDPALLSLGSSRKLWDAARLLPKTVVLYGNLPSKQFYSDQVIRPEAVSSLAQELRQRMAAVGHPFILGTECDVLSVPGCEATIEGKVARMMACGCGCRSLAPAHTPAA